MKRVRKNYLIYLLMLLLFGGLVYLALHIGERFDHGSFRSMGVDGSSWKVFRATLFDNLLNGISILLIQIIVVLLAVRLFSFLFRYIGQPGVIGEIVAGIVLGPSLLGYFFPQVFGWLFREESLTNLELISQLGLILFMFVIGMELDFGVIRKKINETLVISHAGILVPFFGGIVASYWVYEEYASDQTSFLPFALFIGISMSITAFPVLARIIQERNMTHTQVGTLSIASAANDDVTAWCLLAVVIAIAKAGTFLSALYAVGFTAAYILIMFYIVRPFLKKTGEVYATGEVINKTFVSFIFLILVVSSTITELIGIHALFGAFMAGVVMPSNIGFRKVMMEKVEDVALVFFLPLFFAYTGLHTEIGLIDTPQLWGICVLLIAVAVAGKFGGCALAARLVGESWRNSLTIGTLMNTRGLMELVALNIGYEMGVLPPEIFVILVIMALVTTFMTTPLLSFIERIFHKKEEMQENGKPFLLCFGRPQTGKELLSILHFLFGSQLKKHRIVAAHYTMGTDLNPVKAQQYARESFVPIKKEASLLEVCIEERYKVTDKLRQEIGQLAESEQAALLLIGGGLRFHRHLSSLSQWVQESSLPLFREKTDGIAEQVKCPVGIFMNRTGSNFKKATFIVGSEKDRFLLTYIQSILQHTEYSVRIYLFESLTYQLPDQYIGRGDVVHLSSLSQVSFAPDSLLIVSPGVWSLLSGDRAIEKQLPSSLVLRPVAQ